MKKARTKGPAKSRAPSGRPDHYVVIWTPSDVRRVIEKLKRLPDLHARLLAAQESMHSHGDALQHSPTQWSVPDDMDGDHAYAILLMHATAWAEVRSPSQAVEADLRNVDNLERELENSRLTERTELWTSLVEMCLDAHRRLVRPRATKVN